MITEIFNHICTPYGFFQLIMAIAAVAGFVLLKKRNKIDYEKPTIVIFQSSATPPPKSDPDFFKSLIRLSISNPSKFENIICSFKLFSLRSFHLDKLVAENEVDIKLSATSKTNAEIKLNFEDVKNIRGKQAVLYLTDIKDSKIKKKFIFMPSYNQKNV